MSDAEEQRRGATTGSAKVRSYLFHRQPLLSSGALADPALQPA
ncbi:MAG: hypothetical protein OJF50_004941 [Nitrospira sp.]|nr:hypothetical protein [Nitrospira sp.]